MEKKYQYMLTKRQIDVISEALNNRLQYLEGLLLLQQDFKKNNDEIAAGKIAVLKRLIAETKVIQEETSYEGQAEEYKLKKK